MKFNLWTALGAEHLSPRSRAKLGVVAFFYFVQGSPAAILWEVLPVYLRFHAVSLRAIGGLRLLELPYSLKFFWSPLVHRFGDRRVWVSCCMLGISGIVAALPFVGLGGVNWTIIILVLLLTTFSATQDVAIDSYSVGLISHEEEGPANGVRASAYRIALVCVGGGIVLLASVLDWTPLYLIAAGFFAFLGVCAMRVPRLDLSPASRKHWFGGFVGWIATWRAIPLVLFVLLYKLGEFAIGPMVKPFWVDQGRSVFEIGLIPTSFGIVLSVIGSLAGGSFISRYGTFRAVWVLGLFQAVSNLGYAVVDWVHLGPFGLYSASVFESFTGGLGTAAFLALLMNVCEKENATLQYAFLSSIFSFSGRLVGGISGLGAERFGYGNYFAMTFLLSLPAYLLLPWIKPWIHETKK